jgi:APA family basic amino acid/polyamine antiporter
VAMNAILMGGLPLSSWLLCAAWLLCGLSIYVTYGIHHSKIGHQKSSSHSSDTDRLLKDSKDYMSTEQ